MLFPHRSISQGRATNLEAAASLILRRLDAMRLAGVSSQTHDLLDTQDERVFGLARVVQRNLRPAYCYTIHVACQHH